MRYLATGLLLGLVFGGPACAAMSDDPLQAPIQHFIDSFNKGDLKSASEAFAKGNLSIIDEVRPYIWLGPDALQNWAGDLIGDDKKDGVTNESVTLGGAMREETASDRAYVVEHAVYAFKDHGKAMREAALMTFALTRGPNGWLISGWTWTGPKPKPAKH